MPLPLLSVCIPTYNRAPLLEDAVVSVQRFRELGVDVEVVISDNASTDDTESVVRGLSARYDFIRYFRNAENFGVQVNIALSMRRARGKYILYLADDDRLDADQLMPDLRFLEAMPEFSCIVLPVTVVDQRNGTILSQWPEVPQTFKINRGDFLTGLSALLNGLVFPEVALMRRGVAERAFLRDDKSFFAFTRFADAIAEGDIGVSSRPAYQLAFSAGSVGWGVSVGAFEEFRGGLEHFLFRMDQHVGLSPDKRRKYKALIETYIQRRMLGAAHRLADRGRPEEACALLQRLSLWLDEEEDRRVMWALSDREAPNACANEILLTGKEGLGARCLTICATSVDPSFMAVVQRVLTSKAFDAISLSSALQLGRQEETVVLAQSPDLVEMLVTLGFPPTHVLLPGRILEKYRIAGSPDGGAVLSKSSTLL